MNLNPSSVSLQVLATLFTLLFSCSAFAESLEETLLSEWIYDADTTIRLGKGDPELLAQMPDLRLTFEFKKDKSVISTSRDPAHKRVAGTWKPAKVNKVDAQMTVQMTFNVPTKATLVKTKKETVLLVDFDEQQKLAFKRLKAK